MKFLLVSEKYSLLEVNEKVRYVLKTHTTRSNKGFWINIVHFLQ